MARRSTGLLVVLALLLSGCAAHMFTPPSGPGVPAPDAAAAWDAATRPCRDIHNTNATLRVAAHAGRLRSPSIEVLALVTSAGEMRIEDRAVFALAGNAASTSLLLRQQNQIVTAPAADIVEAFIGLKLSPQRLLAILTGCVATSTAATGSARYGKQIAVRTADSRNVYLEQRQGSWRAVGAEVDGLLVDYRAFNGYFPAEWRAARATTGDELILDVVIEDRVFDDPALGKDPNTFRLQESPGATRITVEDLRAMGLFGGRK